jgi:hypothetical protein
MIMATRKEILDNELMKEIATIRLGTLWRMIKLRSNGELPSVDKEQATSDEDDKGAMFLPAGFVLTDSSNRIPNLVPYEHKTPEHFRERIREGMLYDNAILINHVGMAIGVNLDNGFYAKIATNALNNKRSSAKRSTQLQPTPPRRITSEDAIKSFCPSYIPQPYGSRTSLSSNIGVCISEMRLFYEELRRGLVIDDPREQEYWDKLREARKPVLADDGSVLAPPYLVICHSTRYKPEIMTGITRILGTGTFGEFSTFTLEEVTTSLMNEIDGRKSPKEDEIFAQYEGNAYVGVLRMYPSTNYGTKLRPKGTVTTSLISAEKDFNLNLEELSEKYMEKYDLSPWKQKD